MSSSPASPGSPSGVFPNGGSASGVPKDKLAALIVRPFGDALEHLLRKFTSDARLFAIDCPSTLEAAVKVRQLEWSFILCHLDDNDDLIKVVTMMKAISPALRLKRARIVIVVGKNVDRSIEANLKFYGATEVIFEPLPERALVFKLERHVRTEHQQMLREQEQEKKNISGSETAGQSAAEKTGTSAKAADGRGRTVWNPAISLKSDFWLTAKAEGREFMERWMIRLEGPSTTVGRWARVKGSADPGVWQWVPNNPEQDLFVQEPGAWFFRGQRPELQGMVWIFTGAKPELMFSVDGKLVARKFHVDDLGNLVLARDSAAAQELTPLIRESFDLLPPTNRPKTAAEDSGEASRGGRREGGAGNESSESAGAVAPQQHRVRLVGPLAIVSDCWLIESRKPRRVTSKWMVRMIGPGPAIGHWEAQGRSGKDETWRWIPHDRKNDPFVRDSGAWIFHGQCPKFQEETWIFVGENPKLSFVYETGTEHKPSVSKLQVDDRAVLLVARDSAQAESYRPAILESFRSVIRGEEDKKEEAADARSKKKKAREGVSAEDKDDEDDLVLESKANDEERAAKESEEDERDRRTVEEAQKKRRDSKDSDREATGLERELPEGARREDGRGDDSEENDDLVLETDSSQGESGDLEETAENVAKKKGRGSKFTQGGEISELGGNFARDKEDEDLKGSFEREQEGEDLGGAFERERDGKELGGSFEREKEGGELGGAFAGEEGGQGLDGAFEKERERTGKNGALAGAGEGKELRREFEQEAEGAGPNARSDSDEAKTADGKADSTPVEDEPGTPKGIRPDASMAAAADPAQPTLGPIALASLMSELAMRRDISGEIMARKYCDYVSKSCGGMRVEHWVRLNEGPWLCVGTNSGDKGVCDLERLEHCLNSVDPVIESSFAGARVKRRGAAIAVLVITGPKAELVPASWLAAAAAMTVGLSAVFARGAEKPAITTSAA